MLGYEEDPLLRETPLGWGGGPTCRVKARTCDVGSIWGRTTQGSYSVRALTRIRGFYTCGREDETHDCSAVARRRGKECLCVFVLKLAGYVYHLDINVILYRGVH